MEYQAACIQRFGLPKEVLKLEQFQLRRPGPREVRVRMLCAPVHPADISTIQGHYGKLPPLPAVLGNEGVGLVEETGPDVKDLLPGQWVIAPWRVGMWTEYLQLEENELIPLPDDLSLEQASTLSINPLTALRLITDFADLKPGEWILQNAANSAVGQAVIELAGKMGFRTLNIVRRPEVIPHLKSIGADEVILDAEVSSKTIQTMTQNHLPKLGLNTVGGSIVKEMAKNLAPHSPLVTYGGMAREPIEMGAGILIFRDIRFLGFWRAHWMTQVSQTDVRTCIRELADFALQGLFKVPVEASYALVDIQSALNTASQNRRRGKVFLRLSP